MDARMDLAWPALWGASHLFMAGGLGPGREGPRAGRGPGPQPMVVDSGVNKELYWQGQA